VYRLHVDFVDGTLCKDNELAGPFWLWRRDGSVLLFLEQEGRSETNGFVPFVGPYDGVIQFGPWLNFDVSYFCITCDYL
jgi:hypothetical protein